MPKYRIERVNLGGDIVVVDAPSLRCAVYTFTGEELEVSDISGTTYIKLFSHGQGNDYSIQEVRST